MKFRLTDFEKFSIEKLSEEDGMSSRKIAEVVLGSETKKTTVQNYLNHMKHVRESTGEKTYLLTESEIRFIRSEEDQTDKELAELMQVPVSLIVKIRSGAKIEGILPGEKEYYDRLSKKSQKQADMLRVERKVSRESNRVNNMLEELTHALIDVLDGHSMKGLTLSHKSKRNGAPIGVIHLSDLHFGEVIADISDNEFDLSVAAARLRKLVDKAKIHFDAAGVTDVLIACGGDLINSDRRLDEITANATNRAKIIFSAVDTLQQLIMDVNKKYNVTVASVCGNESRIGKDVGWADFTASDNFDAMIHNMLERLFKDNKGVRFIPMVDPLECVINVNGSNFLLVHGHNGLSNTSRIENEVSKVRAKYAPRGVDIDYVIAGHIHSAMISDWYSRSSGLPGGNSYSDKALNLTSKASQNIYIVYDDKSIDAMKIDLQTYDRKNTYSVSDAEEYRTAPKSSTVIIQSVLV